MDVIPPDSLISLFFSIILIMLLNYINLNNVMTGV
jgi:hypothetical protein